MATFGLLLLAVIASACAERETFVGQKVIRVVPETEGQLAVLRNIRDQFTQALEIDWWVDPTRLGRAADLRIKPHAEPVIERIFTDAGMPITVLIADLAGAVGAQYAAAAAKPNGFAFDQYNKLEDINTWIQTLPSQFPGVASVFQVATSYEGRPMYAVKLTGRAAANKPAFWMDGCIHSREWIATATVLSMLNQLLTLYGKDNRITRIVDSLDIYVLPVFNVDGYEYTWTTDRMWRKTRSHNGHVCVGVDPNRNWDFHWGESGASSNPCDDAYYGPKAFSEVEVRTVAEYIKNTSAINAYFNFHSYSQLWMSPWGYTAAQPHDYPAQEDLSTKAVAALTAVHGTKYEYGPIYTTIYPASGNSADWTYGAANVVFSYGVELRDTGQYGFVLPASEIVPSGEETLAGILVAMEYVIAHPRPAAAAHARPAVEQA